MKFTETGKVVYERTYARTKPEGTKETWPETVERVVDGNLALVEPRYSSSREREDLIRYMTEFKILPAGRHLWASGVKGAQHLFNCWVSGWTEKPSEHFEFTFMRLMEGGGVGANYSNHYLDKYPFSDPHADRLEVHIVCDPEHKDYEAMKAAGVLSSEYGSEWSGSFPVEDSREGWAASLVDLIDTHYEGFAHTKRVYDVSRVRPSGARLKTFGGTASGPLGLAKLLIRTNEVLVTCAGSGMSGVDAMDIDHAIAECVVSGGVRRSARMAMMHWKDWQIAEFINIKQATGSHWTTNISVEVDEEFWAALRMEDAEALSVLDMITEGMVRNGEPGFWDSSLSNQGEPNQVTCTNPCGEITLEAWEPCNLGHVNLAAFVSDKGNTDWLGLLRAHELMTRFLLRATFAAVGDPKSREVLDRNRRIGVGHLGVASYLAMTKTKYSTAPADKRFKNLLRELASQVDKTSASYAHELRIPVPVKSRTVAPTGTIAKMPGVSEGIHPIFSKYFLRRIRFSSSDPDQAAQVAGFEAQGYKVENDLWADNTVVVEIPTKDTLVQEVTERYGLDAEEYVEGADELSLHSMLAMQALYQALWADNAVSFTANITKDYPPETVARILQGFGGMLKGATVFPETSMPQAPYERLTRKEFEAYENASVADGLDENCITGCPIK